MSAKRVFRTFSNTKKQALEAPIRQPTRPALSHSNKSDQLPQSSGLHDRAQTLARYISEFLPFGKPLHEFTDDELEYMVAQNEMARQSFAHELMKRAEERAQQLPRNAARRWHGPRLPDL